MESTEGPEPDLRGAAQQAPPFRVDTDEEDAARARRLHDRTGEIELIISGALVFGLFQIPGALGRFVDTLALRLAESQFVAVYMVSFYVRLAVLTLIAAFLLHLVTRAYWVGLIGLDSVFPDGIHWDRIKYGPLAKEVYRSRIRRLSTMARRADDFGSSIFSFAFWISVLFIWSIVFGTVLAAVWYAARLTVWPNAPGVSFFAFAMVVALVPSLAIGIDNALAGRIDPAGKVGRALKAVVAGAYWITAGPIFMPIQFTLFSRIPKKLIWPLFVGVFLSLVLGYVGYQVVASGDGRIAGSAVYPLRPGPRTWVDDHYAASRSDRSRAPFIQARVIRDPYVELVVPIVALRVPDRFEGVCPDFEVQGRAGLVTGQDLSEPADAEYEDAVLGCFAAIWSVGLDGQDLDLAWSFRWEDRFGPTALVAYVPVAGLAAGMHVLEVREIPLPIDADEVARRRREGEELPGPTIRYIPFTL
jgi:hypothetical protein